MAIHASDLYRPEGGWTEKEVAAEAAARMIRAGLINMTPEAIAKVALAIGVPVRMIQQAWSLNRPLPFDDVPASDLAERPEPPKPRYSPRYHGTVKANNDKRKAAKEPVEGMRICAKCDELKDLDDFNFKDKRTLKRQSYCKDCANAYSAERRLNSEALRRFGPTLRFILEATDAHAGTSCADCGEACEPGQEVLATDATIRHASH